MKSIEIKFTCFFSKIEAEEHVCEFV